jgi:TonB family protein
MRGIDGRMRCGLAALLMLAMLPACVSAQKTEADIKARLVDKPLYLRGQWGNDKLEFDAAGHLQGSSPLVSFTVAGIDIESVKLTPKELVLGGQRMGLEFDKDVPKRVGMEVRKFLGNSPEEIAIRIKAPADGDFTAALNAIVWQNLADLDPALPWYWMRFARKHLLSGEDAPATEMASRSGSAEVAPPIAPAGLRKVGGGVTAPQATKQSGPKFSPEARAMKYSGVSTVTMIVGTDGVPINVQIVHPAGLGLDEAAVECVSQYRFSPAMEGGRPVPVAINVEVNFQIL